jgi:hypothetical protein
MTRRERLERRLELRQEWAEKRRARAAAGYARSRELVANIPMGQPILIGHHSEKGHRATLERSDNAMRAGFESEAMANHHANKAEGIERALDRSIFSDDEDATERLQEKIEKAEKLRDAMKAANAIIRKVPKNVQTPEKVAALVAIGFPESRAVQLFAPDFCGRIGFASYELTNLGANIRRMKERIEQIGTVNARKEAAETSPHGVTVEGDEWVRITFAEKPLRMILDSLKGAGFLWRGGGWVGKRDAIPNQVRDLAGLGARPGSLKWWAMDRGFKCIIRCSRVYCWTPGTTHAHIADVDNGRWMENHDIEAEPWRRIELTPDQLANFEAAARDCYCYTGGGIERCDFCTSTRTPDAAPLSSGIAFGGGSWE